MAYIFKMIVIFLDRAKSSNSDFEPGFSTHELLQGTVVNCVKENKYACHILSLKKLIFKSDT